MTQSRDQISIVNIGLWHAIICTPVGMDRQMVRVQTRRMLHDHWHIYGWWDGEADDDLVGIEGYLRRHNLRCWKNNPQPCICVGDTDKRQHWLVVS